MSKVFKQLYYSWKYYGLKYAFLRVWGGIVHEKTKAREILYRRYIQLEEKFYSEEICKWYLVTMGENLNLENPISFCEKIQWLKIYDKNPLKEILCDKYAVRFWIEKQIGKEYLIPLLGEWQSFEEINFNVLPNQFVLKTNHGSGNVIVVKDKKEFDREKVAKKFTQWMRYNYAFVSGFELQYKNIKPLIIAEKYIEQADGNLIDYKFHCFGGKVEFIQVIGDRDIKRHLGKMAFYTKEWKKCSFTTGDYPAYEVPLIKPAKLEEMVEIAEKLSREFCYVRVDLYEIDNKVLFGEMTFTPASGLYPYMTPKEADVAIGKLIRLPI